MGVGDLSNAYDEDADASAEGEGGARAAPQSALQLRLGEAHRFFAAQLRSAEGFESHDDERTFVARTALLGVGSELRSGAVGGGGATATASGTFFITSEATRFGVAPFFIAPGPRALPALGASSDFIRRYALDAPTTASNVVRLLRGMRGKRRPIMLEGAPGVGKSSLVAALAKASGHKLVRINMSEQTDLADLLGGDLPLPEVDDEDLVRSHFFSLLESSFLLFAHLFFCLLGQDEDAGEAAAAAQPTTSAASRKTSKKAEAHASGGSAGAGMFGWCDGPLLRALKEGHWVLLDELNLAPQSVLEGTGVFFCLPLHFTRIMLTI
jgi:hypothetical protein